MRVIFAGGGTGGHLYPGMAIARALTRLEPRVQPFFIGARRGVERDVLPAAGLQHELLDLHPLYRARPWQNWKTLRGALGAWRRVGRLSEEDAPAAVVGTGGYAAGVALAYATVHRIPFVLQEQNSYPGFTVRAFSRFAREIYVGFPEARDHLPASARARVVDAGNPIEPPPATRMDRATARAAWRFPADRGRVLLVFGGSQGSKAMNDVVAEWVGRGLPDDLYLIWATGRSTFAQYEQLESDRVRVRPYLSPIADAYAATDLALVRGGAMGSSELCAWGIPMLMVPLPTAAADHQSVNARALDAAGAAIHIRQSELTSARLDVAVRELLASPDRLAQMAAKALARGRPDAAENIARRVLSLLDLNHIRS